MNSTNQPTKIVLGALVLFGMVISIQAKTPVQLYLNKGGNPVGFLTDSSPVAIKFETEGGGKETYRFTDIKGDGLRKGIVLEERAEALANGRLAFGKKDYRTAAAEFRKVAERYDYLKYVPQNFATEAKFYELECYRRAGAFQAIGPALATPIGKTLDTKLSSFYTDSVKTLKLWAIYGSGDLSKVEEAIAPFQTAEDKLLPTRGFKKMGMGKLAQVAFMRAKVFEGQGKKEEALQDYLRVVTFGQGFDPFLTKQALGAAMVIQAEDPGLKSEKPKAKATAKKGMQSLAYTYSKRFPGEPIPLQFQEYAVRPQLDNIFVKKAEPEKKMEEKKMEEKKMEEKKPAPKAAPKKKPKGKAKATPKK